MASYYEDRDFTKFKKTDYSSWDGLKENVFIRLVNAKHIPKYSQEYEYDIAHIKWMDLALTFSVQETIREKREKVLVSHMLTEQELDAFGVTIDEVREQAYENMMLSRKKRIVPFRYFTLQESTMYPILDMPANVKVQLGGNGEPSGFVNDVDFNHETEKEIENVLVVANKNGHFGSSFMCLPSVLREVYYRFQENYYILPVSSHQIMCIRGEYASHGGRRQQYEVEDDLLEMIEDLNDQQNTHWKDILTYRIYYYAGDDGEMVVPINP